jgi:serine/threonine protein kinase/tetratricopeptide (TPR) repeat protein
MQPPSQEVSTCSNCGGVLEETPGGGLGCMACLLQAGIATKEEAAQDSTRDTLEDAVRFGVYEIDCHADGSLCELGRGAMGVTYRATDTSLQRKVALKIIKSDIAERSADARERFMREARAAAALRHENIATIYQFGMRLETGQYFYAMELIEGETLDDRVRRKGPLDARNTVGIAQQVTSALAAAEKHGLVHRDLKPANLMLVNADKPEMIGRDQTQSKRSRLRALRKSGIPVVKIIDFGLAKAFHSTTDPNSLTHDRFVGTPAFASPEQFEHTTLDVRSDIYSLGETLWFALTGKTPFAGRILSEIHRAQKSNALPTEQLKAAHAPHGLKSLLASMLAFEPASRPGTTELAARLQRCSPEARNVRRTRAALAVATAVVCGLSIPPIVHQCQVEPPPPEKSIAVLPFENLVPDPHNVHITDGVQDEILSDLAQVADLKVISRTSVMQYKSGGIRNLREIAKALGVAHIVEGTVQQAGGRVRVSAQLIDARTDTHIWGDHYDRDLADIFALESDVAEKIVAQLKSKLSPTEKAAIEERPTADLEAYDLYLRGKNLLEAISFNVRPTDNLIEAARLFGEAVARDPSFLLAYCQLAQTHDNIYFIGADHTQQRLELAKAAIDNAFRIRPDSGEAHLALSHYSYVAHRDYDGALSELEIARRSLPNQPLVFLSIARIERRRGQWEESNRNSERALELDPRNFTILQQLSLTYEYQRRYDGMSSTLKRALEIAPDDVPTKVQLAAIPLESRADPKPLHAAIDAIIAADPSSAGALADVCIDLALYERDWPAAQRTLAITDAGCQVGSLPFSHAWCVGVVARASGDTTRAHAAFMEAETEVNKILQTQPDYPEALCVLGLIKAALGQKAQAIENGRRAVDLLPLTKDTVDGAYMITSLALIYAWCGEKKLATEQLEIAARIPSDLNYGQLRLHPQWDPLRGDRRFETLVASLAPKSP